MSDSRCSVPLMGCWHCLWKCVVLSPGRQIVFVSGSAGPEHTMDTLTAFLSAVLMTRTGWSGCKFWAITEAGFRLRSSKATSHTTRGTMWQESNNWFPNVYWRYFLIKCYYVRRLPFDFLCLPITVATSRILLTTMRQCKHWLDIRESRAP